MLLPVQQYITYTKNDGSSQQTNTSENIEMRATFVMGKHTTDEKTRNTGEHAFCTLQRIYCTNSTLKYNVNNEETAYSFHAHHIYWATYRCTTAKSFSSHTARSNDLTHLCDTAKKTTKKSSLNLKCMTCK